MKQWSRLVAAAAAVLFVLATVAGASAASRAHRRHIEVQEPSTEGILYLGERDGYDVAVVFREPDIAILAVESFDTESQVDSATAYGAHFKGSLPFGRLRARFGAVGSISVRFRREGWGKAPQKGDSCAGRGPRDETGSFVGRISLRGEDDYFHVAANKAEGSLRRRFRLRCWVKHRQPSIPPESLRQEVEPELGFSFGSRGGSLAMLEAEAVEGHRGIVLRAAHMEGAPAGAEVDAIAFEYQGKMPVGRRADVPQAPPGTLLTTLPGEHPATATLKPPAPFSGEAEYLATSATSHSWIGSLAVQFPGLRQPLAGAEFASTFCVLSPLRDPYGCDFRPPDWQWAESGAPSERWVP